VYRIRAIELLVDNIKPKTILLTAFEPSGDALGAMATAGLKEIDSNIRVVGLGGSLMESAGVELLEHTTKEAAMGVGALAEIKRIKRLVDVVDAWIKENNPDVVVAIDSPAANWPVCKVARKHGCSVLHLAGPKLWAWAPWRIKKMKRLSDHVMCLLPFEPEWFESRGMPATFIGHPAMKKNVVEEMQLPTGSPRIVLLPGSRKSEIQKNLPMQQEILRRIKIRFPHATAAIACRSEDVELVQLYSNDVHIVSDALPTVLEWANLALCVSGTVSLHVMNHATPMIGMYKVNAFSMLLAKMLLNTPHRLLPNIIAGTRIVPEFIPCLECASTIAEVAIKLLSNEESMHAIQSRLQKEAAIYAEHNPSKESAELILSFTQ
jgi:lipid-A-disaccharide synthase